MFLYHASTVPISTFHINQKGLHFGSVNSALDAALRYSEKRGVKYTCTKSSSQRLLSISLTIVGPVGLSLDRGSAYRLLNLSKKLNGKEES